MLSDHKTLRQQLKMYCTDIDPFISAAKSHVLIKDVCCDIIQSFKELYLEELERHASLVKNELLQKKYLTPTDSRLGSEVLCSNLDELYACLTTENYPDGLGDLKPALSEAYITMVTQIV